MSKTSKKINESQEITSGFIFDKMNYYLMFAGLFLIVLGFVIMSGGSSENVQEFNDAIFNTRRLVVAPIIVLLGYSMEIYAIMYKRKKKED